tara:strand:- start:4103 stop:8938 length:4836 start_codon:yes stop_codon:yes gene_type:complete
MINATLALLLRLTSSGVSLSEYWVGVGCATVLAVEHFNTRNATVVPELATLDSPLQLQPLYLNTDSLQAGGLTAYRAALAAGPPHGLLGPPRSAVSVPTAQLGAIDSLPQLSYWASSPTLSDKSIYSHFGRTYPSDSVSGGLVMQTASAFGWVNVACIYVNDVWAQGLLTVMQSWSGANPGGAKIALAATFNFGDATSLQQAVADVAASHLNIIVFIVFDSDLDVLLSAADEAGLLGDEFVWICTDTTTADSPANTANPALTAQRLAGTLALTVAPSRTEGYGRLAAVWSELTPADCANDLFNATDATFSTGLPPDVGAYAYNAVIAFGLAFAAAHANGTALGDGDAIRDQLWATGFNGSTGEVRFSSETGDLVAEGLIYALKYMQLQDDGALVLHEVGSVVSGSVGSLSLDAPIVWRGGGSATPVDLSMAALSCEPGTVEGYTSSATPTCTQCEAGTYEVSRKLCTPAGSYSYAPSAGANETTGRLPCPSGTRVLTLLAESSGGGEQGGLGVEMQASVGASNASQCVCDIGSYNAELLEDPDWAGAPRCVACPDGAICAGAYLLPVALPGFAMLAHADPTKAPFFLECKGGPLACPGGTIEPLIIGATEVTSAALSSDSVVQVPYRCGDGYLNGSSGCYRCEDGYGMQAKQCVECQYPAATYTVLNLLFVLCWFPVLRILLTQYVKSFYTSIAFLQFLGVYSSFPLPWGSGLADVFEVLGSFNLDLDALGVSCSAGGRGHTYRNLWGIQMALPLFYPVAVLVHLVVGRALTWLAAYELPGIRLLLWAGWRPRRDFSFAQLVRLYLPQGLFYLNMYLMTGVKTSLHMLSCADDGNGGSFLRADPGIECWKGGHVGLAACAVLGVIVYLGVVPAIYSWVLFVVLPLRGRQSPAAKPFFFIFGRFEAEYFFWEFIESGRKVVFVFVAIFGEGYVLEQSVVALAAVVAVLILDLLCHPYVSGLYDVLEEVLAFVEFMVLLLGLVALAQPAPGGWHEVTAWVFLVGALALIAYTALFDLDSVWQSNRTHRLRSRHRLTLSPTIWHVGAFDSVLLDWLEQASPAELASLAQFDEQLMRAHFSGALDARTKRTRQYTEQLKALPFMLNNMCGKPDGSLDSSGGTTVGSRVRHPTRGVGTVVELMDDGRTRIKFDAGDGSTHRYKPHRLQSMAPLVTTVGEMLTKYLATVSGNQVFGGSAMPMQHFFQRGARGALCAWLGQPSPESLEARVQLHGFFASIIAFADAQKATMPWHVRLRKRLRVNLAHSRRSAQAQRAAAAEAKAHAAAHATSMKSLRRTVHHGLDETVHRDLGARALGRQATMVLFGKSAACESRTERLLARLLTLLRCEMVEVVAPPASESEQSDHGDPLPRSEQLVAAAVVHPSAQIVRRFNKGQAVWSTPGCAVGLCATKRLPVFVENGRFKCGEEEGRLKQKYKVGEISQLCVPIFQYRCLTALVSKAGDAESSRKASATASAHNSAAIEVEVEATIIQEGPGEHQQISAVHVVQVEPPGRRDHDHDDRPGGPAPTGQEAPAGQEQEQPVERKLLGVLRCSNKFAASSSRAGYTFPEADAAIVALFASLIAEVAAKELLLEEMVVKVQRSWRRHYRRMQALLET